MAQDFWDPVPASSWVLSGMGWLSPCRAHSKLQFVQLAILQMPLGHKMKTKAGSLEKEYQRIGRWSICFKTYPKASFDTKEKEKKLKWSEKRSIQETS